jgi:hypothetical protein
VIAPSRDMLVRNAAPAGAAGRAFGIVSTGFNLGGIVSPLLFGWIMDQNAPHWVFGASVVFMVLTVVLALSPSASPQAASEAPDAGFCIPEPRHRTVDSIAETTMMRQKTKTGMKRHDLQSRPRDPRRQHCRRLGGELFEADVAIKAAASPKSARSWARARKRSTPGQAGDAGLCRRSHPL